MKHISDQYIKVIRTFIGALCLTFLATGRVLPAPFQASAQDLFLDQAPPASAHTQPSRELRGRWASLKPGLLAELRDHFKGPGHKPSFRFNFFDDAAHELLIDRFHTTGPNRASLWGRVNGKPGGFAVIALEGNAMSARVFVPGEGTYRVHYAGNGVHRVWQEKEGTGSHCALEGPDAPVTSAFMPQEGQPLWLPQNYPVGCAYSGSPVVVDLLALYTPKALAEEGSLAALDTDMDEALAYTNMAYVNSQVNVEMRLVGLVPVSYNEAGISTDFSDLVNYASTPGLTNLAAWRTSYGADLVALVESDGAGTSTGGGGEIGGEAVIGGWLSVDTLDELDATLPHETGHNFGCMHDRQTLGEPTGNGYDFGYRFTAQGVTFHDIMAYDPGATIPYFSNPNVSYFGVPEGVPDTDPTAADTARVINQNAPSVAAYEPTASGDTLPSVDVISPAPGLSVPGPAGVTLSADATANNGGSIAQVDFFVDSLYVGTSTSAPFQYFWQTVSEGSHFVTAHAIDNGGGLRFSCPVSFYAPKTLPSPWVDQDVGPFISPAGSANYSAGTFTLNASYYDPLRVTYPDNDASYESVHYVYQPFCGNGAVTARIVSETSGGGDEPGCFVGVMFRQSLAPESPMVWVGYQNYGGWDVPTSFYRATASAQDTNGPNINVPGLPYWVSLSRTGDVFQWSFSPDGVAWTTDPTWTTTIPMGTNIYVGLAATSGNPALLNTAVVDNVSVTMACVPPTYTPTPTITQTFTVTLTPTLTLTPTMTPTATPLPCALVIPSGASVTLSNNTYSFCSVNVQSGGTLIIGGAVTLNLTGFLNVDGTINGAGNGYGSSFAPGSGPGAGGNSITTGGACGGGHGGSGGFGNGMFHGIAGATYDSPTQPVSMGSQGGTGFGPSNTGGYGGAALVVDVPAGNVTINGNIIMNGGSASSIGNGGGGSGGTISIDAVGIYGTGYLMAEGGMGGANSAGVTNFGGGGGGGLVRVCASNHIPFPGGVNGGINNVQGGPSGIMMGSGTYLIGNGSYGFYYDCNPTFTPTLALTSTPTPTPTSTFTATLTPSSTGTSTSTPTASNTSTPSSTNTPAATFTRTSTGSATPSSTPSPTASNTSTSSSTNTPTATFTQTSTDSATPSPTPSPTATNTSTPSPTNSPTPTDTNTSSSTPTHTFSPTPTPTITDSPTPTASPVPSVAQGTVGIYPNPAPGGSVSLLIPPYWGTGDVRIQVFTVAFRKVRDRTFPVTNSGTSLEITLTDNWGKPLANGLYYVAAWTPRGRSIGKLLILR